MLIYLYGGSHDEIEMPLYLLHWLNLVTWWFAMGNGQWSIFQWRRFLLPSINDRKHRTHKFVGTKKL